MRRVTIPRSEVTEKTLLSAPDMVVIPLVKREYTRCRRSKMALQTSGNMLDRVTVTLSRREIALMNLCLGVVACDHARGGNLRADIESLQTRLAQYHAVPSTFRKR